MWRAGALIVGLLMLAACAFKDAASSSVTSSIRKSPRDTW